MIYLVYPIYWKKYSGSYRYLRVMCKDNRIFLARTIIAEALLHRSSGLLMIFISIRQEDDLFSIIRKQRMGHLERDLY